MGRPRLSDEERERRRKETVARYKAKKGVAIGCKGPKKKGIERRIEMVNGVQVVREVYTDPMPLPRIRLTEDSSLEDIRKWIIQVCENLANCPQPAAWASAATIMQKNLELFIKLTPPPAPVKEDRPRITITLED